MTNVNTNIKLYLKTPCKSYGVSVLGLGHSDIRGLVTYRSMVRRELYCLLAWITKYIVPTRADRMSLEPCNDHSPNKMFSIFEQMTILMYCYIVYFPFYLPCHLLVIVFSHHSPNKTRKFSRNCRLGQISIFIFF